MNTDQAPQPACADPAEKTFILFDELIDKPGSPWLANEAAKFCSDCALRDTCLPKHVAMGEADQAWAEAVIEALMRAPKQKRNKRIQGTAA